MRRNTKNVYAPAPSLYAFPGPQCHRRFPLDPFKVKSGTSMPPKYRMERGYKMTKHSIRASVLLGSSLIALILGLLNLVGGRSPRFLRGKTLWADIGAMGYDWQSSSGPSRDGFLGGSASRDQSMRISTTPFSACPSIRRMRTLYINIGPSPPRRRQSLSVLVHPRCDRH